MVTTTDFVVIGAGLAGLAFAGDAQAAGKTVCLFDRGRSVGGRAATRNVAASVKVDHGAQHFTARGQRFRTFVETWRAEEGEAGGLLIWSRGFPRWQKGQVVAANDGHPRYAPLRGMRELAERLAGGLAVHTEATVTSLVRSPDGLWAVTAATPAGPILARGRSVVLAVPSAPLLRLAGAFLPEATRQGVAAVTYEPCWALIACLNADIPVDWPALDLSGEGGHPVLSFLSRDHTKRRNDPSAPPVLVAHASGDWSREHLEDAPEAVTSALLAAVRGVIGGELSLRETHVHRWRYARARERFGQGAFWHAEIGLGGCGDWCDAAAGGGGKIEGALESGWHLAATVLGAQVS